MARSRERTGSAEVLCESTAVLEVREVSKRFDAVVALKSATLTVQSGEVHALMGANGAGKSTLVKILTGVYPADGGVVLVRGEQRNFRSPGDARRGGIVSVYQEPALVPDLTVGQNLRLAKVSNNAVRGWLKELGVGGLDLGTFVRELPYPVLRLVDLARALASEPIILLLDEITSALPADLSERVFAVVRRWRDAGNAVIFISHRMAEVSALCDRTTVLRDGVTVGVTQTARGSEDRIVSLMLGREATQGRVEAKHKPSVASSESNQLVALEVRDLRCGHTVKGVSFSLRAREVLGIAALDGQGQQELFDCIAGLRRFDSGSIRANGRELNLRHPADAIRAGLVLVPANRLQALLSQRSIRENVGLPAFRGVGRWGPIHMRAERGRVAAAVKRLQIDTRAESELSRLSGGNQQKVVIARWLANGFKTLLCFDPTRGIDIGTKQQIYALVRELANAGSAVLLFTSELTEIAMVCDRALVLFGGRIVHEMPAAEAHEETLLRAAHGLAPQVEANS